MEFEADILEPFVTELIENYRQKILEQEDAGRLLLRRRGLADELEKKMKTPHPELYRLVTDYAGAIYDLNGICQEQLYIQGVKDGIRIRRLVGEIEEGKSADQGGCSD